MNADGAELAEMVTRRGRFSPGLRAKIIAITSAVVLVAIGAIVTASDYLFTREYTQALQSRSLAIGKGLTLQLERLLQLGLAAENITGFEEQCREAVASYPGLDHAMVVSRRGRILFHSEPAMMGWQVTDPDLLRAIEARREAVVRHFVGRKELYSAILPARGPGDVSGASVVVAFPASAIASRSREITILGVGLGIVVLGIGMTILVFSLRAVVTGPITALIEAVQRTRGGGQQRLARAEVRSSDEVGQLAAAFNEMIARIDDVIQRERQFAAAEAAAREQTTRLDKLTETVRHLEESRDAGVNLLEDLDQRRRDLEIEIATREAAEAALRETLDRRQRQFEVTGAVSRSEWLASGEVERLAAQVTELAAKAAGCARVNVWLFNEDESELRCIDLFEADSGRHSAELVLHAAQFAAEFHTLKTDRYVDAHDAQTDPRTAGYAEGYLKPLGIVSMLDVLIGASGRHHGLLCFEHVGKPHQWEPDEIAFAGQLADKIAFALGIRARWQADEKIKASEAALAKAQTVAHIGSWEFDPRAGRLAWSDETYRIFGVDRASFTPSYEALLARVHPDDRALLDTDYKDSLAQRRAHDVEHRVLMDDGRVKWVHERGETTFDTDGTPIRSIGTVQDITARKLPELALAESRQIIQGVFDGVPVRLFWKDKNLTYLGCNAAFARDAGLADPKDLIGKDDFQMGWRDQAEAYRADDRLVIESGQAKLFIEEPQTTPDGKTITLLTSKLPLRRPNGEIYGVLGTYMDISERKRAEQALVRERDFSDALVDGLPGIFFVLDHHGRNIRINANLTEVMGRPAAEIVGTDAIANVVPADQEMARASMREVFERGHAASQELGIVAAGGEARRFMLSARRIQLEGGPGVLGVGVDITEMRRAERLLRESQERFKGLVENSGDWVWEMDPEFRYTYASPRSMELFGYRPEELVGRSAFDFMTPADAERTARETESLFAERRPMIGFQTTFVHKDGHVVVTETNASPFFDTDGRYCGYRGIDRDVTERNRITEALRDSEEKLRTVFSSVTEGIFLVDSRTGGFVDVNGAGCEMLGHSRDELLRLTVADISSGAPGFSAAGLAQLFETVRTRGSQSLEWQVKSKQGRVFWCEVSVRSTRFGDQDRLLATIRDVTERRRVTEALRESEIRFRTVAETAQDAIISVDSKGLVRFWNRAAERTLGYSQEEALGKSVHDWITPERFREKAHAGMRTFAAAGSGPVVGKTLELVATRKDGAEIPVELSIASMQLAGEWHAVAILRDITDRKQAEAQILQMARFDALTGLANRRVFAEGVEQAIARAQRGGKSFAVLYLDLDHFKDVNDTLGHPVGDLLLKSVAERLKACVRATDTVARFGGDEFAVLAVDINDPMDAGVLGEKILAVMSKPVTINGNDIRCGTSVGIAVFGPDSGEAESLLTHADVALYRAKSEGRGTYRFFTEAMDAEVRRRVTLDSDLRAGLEQNQFFLVYQPQVESASGRITGMEALVRWNHPERGIVSPAEFIPAAEKNGLIVPIGRWVLREACRQAKAWRDAGLPPAVVGVNLSALQFKTPRELEQSIADALAENDLPPSLLELELTESVLMKASHEHNDVLLRLRERGLRIAIDDFGTGFSSLDYLRRFPVDRIKIAQVFIIDLVTAAGDAAIVKAAIGLARELGINVIAEGVETAAQLRLLQSWGCREVQGYYFAKPLTADDIAPLLRAGKLRAAPAATAA